MSNKELLLAISDMMDQKLDAVFERMDRFDTKLDAVDEKLTAEIRAVDEKLSSEIRTLDNKIQSVDEKLSAEIRALDEKLSSKIQSVDERLSSGIKNINITLENIVIPRIKHIEQCYLSTSERYLNEAGRINGLTADVQIIKSIVQDHSIQLQKIS